MVILFLSKHTRSHAKYWQIVKVKLIIEVSSKKEEKIIRYHQKKNISSWLDFFFSVELEVTHTIEYLLSDNRILSNLHLMGLYQMIKRLGLTVEFSLLLKKNQCKKNQTHLFDNTYLVLPNIKCPFILYKINEMLRFLQSILSNRNQWLSTSQMFA